MQRSENGIYLDIDDEGKIVTDLEIDPTNPRYEKYTALEVTLMKKDLLITSGSIAVYPTGIMI